MQDRQSGRCSCTQAAGISARGLVNRALRYRVMKYSRLVDLEAGKLTQEGLKEVET